LDTVGSLTPVPLPEPLKLADGGLVWWLPGFLSPATADSLLRRLWLEVDWQQSPGLAPEIASLLFGASRRFRLRTNCTRETLDLELSGGSLLLMRGTLQHHCQQTLARTRRVVGEPINLTFRHVAQR